MDDSILKVVNKCYNSYVLESYGNLVRLVILLSNTDRFSIYFSNNEIASAWIYANQKSNDYLNAYLGREIIEHIYSLYVKEIFLADTIGKFYRFRKIGDGMLSSFDLDMDNYLGKLLSGNYVLFTPYFDYNGSTIRRVGYGMSYGFDTIKNNSGMEVILRKYVSVGKMGKNGSNLDSGLVIGVKKDGDYCWRLDYNNKTGPSYLYEKNEFLERAVESFDRVFESTFPFVNTSDVKLGDIRYEAFK